MRGFHPRYLYKEFSNSLAPRFSYEQQRIVNISSQNFAAAEFVLEAFAGLVGVSSAISLETFICNIFTCKQLRGALRGNYAQSALFTSVSFTHAQ